MSFADVVAGVGDPIVGPPTPSAAPSNNPGRRGEGPPDGERAKEIRGAPGFAGGDVRSKSTDANYSAEVRRRGE